MRIGQEMISRLLQMIVRILLRASNKPIFHDLPDRLNRLFLFLARRTDQPEVDRLDHRLAARFDFEFDVPFFMSLVDILHLFSVFFPF